MITNPLLFAAAVAALVGLLAGFLAGWIGATAQARQATEMRENRYTATKIGV